MRLHPAVVKVRDHLSPHRFRIADKDAVGVLRGLFRDQCDVIPAHDDLAAALFKLRGDPVASFCRIGLDGDRDQIDIDIVIDALDAVIKKDRFHIDRGQ